MLQAVITATVAGLVVILGVVFKSWPVAAIPTTWVITFALAWWLLLLNTRGLLKTVERVIRKDLDGDGEIGFTVEITDLSDGKKKMSFAHFPARPEQVLSFAAAMINGQMTIYGNHKLSRRVFSVLRDESISRGLCAWVNPDHHPQGFELTRAGNHVFERLLLERGV